MCNTGSGMDDGLTVLDLPGGGKGLAVYRTV
jgi:hypothetical protein